MLDKLVRLCIYSQRRVFQLPWWYFPVWMERFIDAWIVLQVEVLISGWCSRGLSLHRKKLEEVDFVDKEFLHKKINKKGVSICGLW